MVAISFSLAVTSRRRRRQVQIVAAYPVVKIVGTFFLLLGLRKRLLAILLLDRLFYVWKGLTEEAFALFPWNIRRIEFFSLD